MNYRYVFGSFAVLTLLSVVLAACGSTGTAPSGSQEVRVTVSEYKITSSQTTFFPEHPTTSSSRTLGRFHMNL